VPPRLALQPEASRWSLSGWALLRRGSAPQLAPGGTLGGSQIGARVTYRLNSRTSVSARLYSPVDETSGAEAAVGIDWQPLRSLPLRLLAERRQKLGAEGRSAFAVTAYGGINQVQVAGPVRLNAYAQAGVVGVRSRDLFVDGSASLRLPVADDISVGAGAWGAAQPGAARLDFGPEATLRIPDARLSVSASYRVRVAGDARPGSGPALTLSTDF
jgi:hypothetical protein